MHRSLLPVSRPASSSLAPMASPSSTRSMTRLCCRPCQSRHLSSQPLRARQGSAKQVQARMISPVQAARGYATRPPSNITKAAASSSAPPQIIPAVASGRKGPFSATAAILFFIVGAGLVFYFRQEKARLDRQRIAEQSKGVGKPKVGGEFVLTDQDGQVFTHRDLRGGFSIIYFGFTHCPDICPDELDKLARIIDLVSAQTQSKISTSSFLPLNSPPSSDSATTKPPPSKVLLPVFITCDPARDKPEVIKHYLAEFHPGIVGLTGSWDAVRDVCKKYRVYFSTPENVKPGQDYLVDHSIYLYLMDPEGDFVEAIGRQHSPETAAQIIGEHMGDWKGKA